MIELMTSHGYESIESKLLMRISVIISDIIFYLPFCYLFTSKIRKYENNIDKFIHYFILTIFPSLLLIDHGHFQVYKYINIIIFIIINSIIQYHWVYH